MITCAMSVWFSPRGRRRVFCLRSVSDDLLLRDCSHLQAFSSYGQILDVRILVCASLVAVYSIAMRPRYRQSFVVLIPCSLSANLVCSRS